MRTPAVRKDHVMDDRRLHQEPAEEELDLTHVPAAVGWRGRAGGSRRMSLLMAGSGLLFVLVGAVLLMGAEKDDRLAGVAVLAFGAMALVMAPSFRDSTSHARLEAANVETIRPERGVAFLYSRHRRRMMVAGGACFSVAALVMAVAPDALASGLVAPEAVRAIGIVGTLFFGLCAIGAAWMRTTARVVLTPTGVLNEAGLPRSFVPWDAIGTITAYAIHTEPLIGIYPTDPSLIEVSSRGRFVTNMNRRLGPDVALPVRGLQNPPVVLLGALLHYHRNPQDRQELATEKGLSRLSRAATHNIA